MKKIKGYLFKDNKSKVVNINNTLDNFYSVLECDTIELPKRLIGNKAFFIMCDEEACYKKTYIQAVCSNAKVYESIKNAIIVFGVSDNNDIRSLTKDEITLIKGNILLINNDIEILQYHF